MTDDWPPRTPAEKAGIGLAVGCLALGVTLLVLGGVVMLVALIRVLMWLL